MRRSCLLLCAFTLLLASSACARSAPPDTPAAGTEGVVAFVGVHVVPMDAERVLRDHTVVVRGGRITAVGPAAAVDVPDDARIIEGRGRYLLPGLAEMHGHIPPPSAPEAYTEDVLFLYVANGITTVRGMLGYPGQLALRERAHSGELIAPTLYLAGPSFNGQSVSSPAQAEAMVRRQKAEGWDLLKIHPGLTRDEYDAMARTANELSIRFGGHVPADVGLLHALEMGQETFDHLDGYVEYLQAEYGDGPIPDDAYADLVRRTKEADAWVVPTMALWETLYGTADLDVLHGYPELQYAPASDVAAWTRAFEQRVSAPGYDVQAARAVIDARMRLLGALSDGGARILMGTDAPQQFSVPGFSLHRELQRMADAGMTPYQILHSGTRQVGAYFAESDAFGAVTPGQRADLVLVEGNPLADVGVLARPEGVMVRGRWLDRAALDARLQAVAARNDP